jgi:adenylate cyclase
MVTPSAARSHTWKLPLHKALAVVFVPLFLMASALLVLFWSQETDRLIQIQAQETFTRTFNLAADQMRALVQPVEVAISGAAELPEFNRRANSEDAARLRGYWFRVLAGYPQLSSIYVAYSNGAFVQLGRIEPGTAATLKAPPGARLYERRVQAMPVARGMRGRNRERQIDNWRYYNADFLPMSTQTRLWTGPDSRKRDWYAAASAAPGIVVTSPYIFATTRNVGLSIAMASRANRGTVIGADISLDKFSAVLSNALKDEPLSAALVTSAGTIAATANAGHDSAAALRSAIQTHFSNPASAGRPAQLLTKDQHLIRIQPLIGNGQELWLAAATSREVLAAPFLATQQRSIAISLGLMLALAAVVTGLASRISRPLRLLALQATRLQKLDLSESPGVHSRVSEVVSLDQEIEQASQSLRGMGRYIPRSLAEHLLNGSISPTVGGTRREVTLFFSDIENFSLWAETQDPSVLAQDMSEYLESVTDVLRAHDGTIDKFIGDSVMAFWNAPNPQEDAAEWALAAAMALQLRLAALNEQRKSRGQKAFRTRIGLHVGQAWVGNVGTSERLSYTALGGVVNAASRIEGLNKRYGTSILVSDALAQRLMESGHALRFIDHAVPHGTTLPIGLYEPLAQPLSPQDQQLWEQAQTDYQSGDFEAAAQGFRAWLLLHPEDTAAKALLSQCGRLLAAPPKAPWTGVLTTP